MKKLNIGIITLLASVLTLVATSVSSTACIFTMYQPKEPKCLAEE